MMKADILRIGFIIFDEAGDAKLDQWSFDCKMKVPMLEFQDDGTPLVAGYTIDELVNISDDFYGITR